MSPTLANEAINAISVRFESIMTFQNLSHLLYFMINTDMPIEFLVLIILILQNKQQVCFCKLIALHLAPNLKRMIPWEGKKLFSLKIYNILCILVQIQWIGLFLWIVHLCRNHFFNVNEKIYLDDVEKNWVQITVFSVFSYVYS